MKKVIILGKFLIGMIDNCKYFYNYLCRINPNFDYFFVAETERLYRTLKERNLPVLYINNLSDLRLIKEADICVLDDMKPKHIYKHLLPEHTKFVQLWHGIPLKDIRHVTLKKDFLPDFCEVFTSTSNFFTEHAFKNVFNAKEFVVTGYPRNDVFFKDRLDENDFLNVDLKVYERVLKEKEKGKKIGVIMPTLSYTKIDMLLSNVMNFESLEKISKVLDILFVLKLHPVVKMRGYELEVDKENIIVYEGDKDIYPILSLSDFLITDYSSVYFDYLLLDKPIIFYLPDYEIAKKKLMFSEECFFPGKKTYTMKELLKALKELVKKDLYRDKREFLKSLSFKYFDGKSSERVYNAVKVQLLSDN